MPKFMRIGTTFSVEKTKWYGTVVASAESIYLFLETRRNDVANAVGGGLVGGLIAGAVAGALERRLTSGGLCAVSDLPADVLNHPDWPAKSLAKKRDLQVVVVPRSAVSTITHPSWGNLLRLEFQGQSVVIEYLLLRGAKVRDFLAESGWALDWAGKPVGRQPSTTV